MNRAGNNNQDVVVIGHNGHQEVAGTIGQYTGSPDKVHVVNSIQDIEALNIDGENAFFATQTTLSVDETRHVVEALKKKVIVESKGSILAGDKNDNLHRCCTF